MDPGLIRRLSRPAGSLSNTATCSVEFKASGRRESGFPGPVGQDYVGSRMRSSENANPAHSGEYG